MARIHPHYANTRFDAPHSDKSGHAKYIPLNQDGGFFVTHDEFAEYNEGGWLFDKVGFDE